MADTFIYSGNSVPPGGTVGQVLTKVGGPNYYTAWRSPEVASGDAQTITLSGDITGTGTTSILTTLTSTGVTAGTYNNSATSVRPFTVDIKGRITAIGSAVTVTPAFSSITSKPTSLAGYGITDAPTTTGTGASGTWGINVTGNAATATHAANSSKLYSTDAIYAYGSSNPYYGFLTFDGTRWLFQVSPGTPAAVRVAYSDASGTAGSCTGNAATASSSSLLSALGNYVWNASTLPTGFNQGIQTSFVSSGQGFQDYGSVVTVNTYSGGGGALQLFVPYSPTYGGTGLQVRFGNYDVSSGNSWTSWKTLLASDNYTSYAPSLTGTGASGTWAINVTGSSASCSGNATTATTASHVAATADQAIVNQQNGNTSAWFGRILSKNATSDRAAFLGTYAGIAGVFSHNNALNAWADLYVNTVDGSSGGSVRLPSTVFINGNQALHAGNYTSYSPSLTGTGASGTWSINVTGSSASCTGNAATANSAVNLSTSRGDWASNGTISAVVGQLAWKNYNNGHTIFDASAGTSPDGGAVNNTNPMYHWQATFPTLMGWNGENTYGVRVDSARRADSAASADTASAVSFANVTGKPTTLSGYGITDALALIGGTLTGRSSVSVNSRTTSYTGSSFELFTSDNTPPGISFHRGGYSATLLYESDGELFVNAWTTRAQSGKLLSSGNYNSYSPSLTGLGASGSWGINITGTAGSVAAANVSGLGTIATQNSDNVSITGGSIDGLTYDDGTY